MDAQQIRRHVAQLHARGLDGRSLARMLSAWRGFFNYLARDHGYTHNPCAGVRAPRTAKRLPHALSPDEAGRLMDIAAAGPLAVRDKAIVELLYSSGLRLSELTGLEQDDVNIRDATVRVTGKGAKTRIVPVGGFALAALKAWAPARGTLARPGETALFVGRDGTALGARAVQARLKHWALQAGPRGQGAPARAAALVRLAPAAVERGPARGAGNAGAREHLHDAGLHAPRLPASRESVRRRASAGEKTVVRLILKPGREKSLKRRHPWVFSGAVAKIQGQPGAGDTVEVRSADGAFLALAAYSPESQIVARVWDWSERAIDHAFFQERVSRAVAQRKELPDGATIDAYRLLHGESDGLPGVVADRYGDTLVLQLTSAGAERWREAIAGALLEATGASRVWERSDAEVRTLEGLAPATGPVRGAREPTRIVVSERGIRFEVDFERGHKTGFYLDQRETGCGCGSSRAGATCSTASAIRAASRSTPPRGARSRCSPSTARRRRSPWRRPMSS